MFQLTLLKRKALDAETVAEFSNPKRIRTNIIRHKVLLLDDINYEIVEFLSIDDILALRCTNKYYNRFTKTASVWKNISMTIHFFDMEWSYENKEIHKHSISQLKYRPFQCNQFKILSTKVNMCIFSMIRLVKRITNNHPHQIEIRRIWFYNEYLTYFHPLNQLMYKY